MQLPSPGLLKIQVGLRSAQGSMGVDEVLHPDGTCVQALCVSLDMFHLIRVMMASPGNRDLWALR